MELQETYRHRLKESKRKYGLFVLIKCEGTGCSLLIAVYSVFYVVLCIVCVCVVLCIVCV